MKLKAEDKDVIRFFIVVLVNICFGLSIYWMDLYKIFFDSMPNPPASWVTEVHLTNIYSWIVAGSCFVSMILYFWRKSFRLSMLVLLIPLTTFIGLTAIVFPKLERQTNAYYALKFRHLGADDEKRYIEIYGSNDIPYDGI